MSEPRGLFVPDLPPDCDLIKAALAYATAGWYVGPVARGTKNPGSILGDSWPSKTSRDPEQIVLWFAGTDAGGLFLHVGRSGGVVFDVDRSEKVPDNLSEHLWADGPMTTLVPFQQTRPDGDIWRGHYLFEQPPGRRIGNSLGGLVPGWGEVRGTNGVIIVFPTEHPDGGEYRWVRGGPVPVLAEPIASLLPDGGDHESSVDDDTVEAFLDSCTSVRRPGLGKVPPGQFARRVREGESRHEAMVSVLCMACRDGAQGMYVLRPVVDTLRFQFQEALKGERRRWPDSEFDSMLAFAVAQAMVVDPDERREETVGRLEARDRERRETPPPPVGSAEQVDPQKYFLDKTVGFDVALCAADVLTLGPIARGADHAPWAYIDGVWRHAPDEIIDRVVHLLGPYFRLARAKDVQRVVMSRAERITCGPVEGFWNTRNGMLNWRTGELIPHGPEYGSTVQFPWEWDPQATCPEFDKFLRGVLEPDFVELAWQMIAYLLYSGNPRQVAFLLSGKGENGKGTLMRVLTALLGQENVSAASLDAINRNRFATISLLGKIANLAGDIDATYQEATATFKQITGEDQVDGEHKYGARVPFTNWAVPVFSANKPPASADVGHGYLRRWQIIKFDKKISKRDRIEGLSDILAREVQGIAVKALPVLQELMAAKWFKSGGLIAVAQSEFAEAIDQVREWVAEACEVVPGNRTARSELYQSYRAWASASGIRPVSAREFSIRLDSAGYPLIKSSNWFHDGLRVKQLRMQGTVIEDPFTGQVVDLAEPTS